MYFVKTPWWLPKLLPASLIWRMPADDNKVYLTFDDGPHPEITSFVLDELQKAEAKATFFCVGNRVAAHPEIFSRIQIEGHQVGNHTYNHLNGKKTDTQTYLDEIKQTDELVGNRIFRPPYGRITRMQVQALEESRPPFKIYMWDVLTGDFDATLSAEKCAENAIFNTKPGSIIIFHDSEKAWPRLQTALPRFLEHCRKKGWELATLPL